MDLKFARTDLNLKLRILRILNVGCEDGDDTSSCQSRSMFEDILKTASFLHAVVEIHRLDVD